MNLENLTTTLLQQLWQLLMNRIYHHEQVRRWESDEIPDENYNKTILAVIFDALHQSQINCLCRLDVKKNLSFNTTTKHGSEFGFKEAEIMTLVSMIKEYRSSIGDLKTEHRNLYIGHLSKSYDGKSEMIDFDPLIQRAYDITSFILREKVIIKIGFGNDSEVILTEPFSGEK